MRKQDNYSKQAKHNKKKKHNKKLIVLIILMLLLVTVASGWLVHRAIELRKARMHQFVAHVAENVPELPKIISLLDEMRITYYVVLTQDLSGETGLYGNWEKELEGGTPDGKLTVVSFNGELGPSEHRVINTDNYRILSESRIQAIQINISGFENPLNVVKKLFKLRGSVERKIPFEILITTDSDLWEDGLIELALEEFIKEDCIVLTPSDSREDGGQLINILLKKLRENDLTGNVVLNGINSETLWKNNIDFLARQKDIHEKYLWIDSECLEGKSLEAPPFPRR